MNGDWNSNTWQCSTLQPIGCGNEDTLRGALLLRALLTTCSVDELLIRYTGSEKKFKTSIFAKIHLAPATVVLVALAVVTDPDMPLVEALRRGEENAYVRLVRQYHRTLLRLVSGCLKGEGSAEDVVQETWLGVLRGLSTFEGRCSFRSWVFRIAINIAKKRALHDARCVPFAALDNSDNPDHDEPAVDSNRFLEANHRWAGHWSSPPIPWPDAERQMLAQDTLHLVAQAIDALPHVQRQVITLRDVQGLTADEAGEILGISESNQRVLLHRARSKVRAALDALFERNFE